MNRKRESDSGQSESEQKRELLAKLASTRATRLREMSEEDPSAAVSDFRKDPSGNEMITIADLKDEELLRICAEYFKDLDKLGRELPENLGEIKVNPTPQPAWKMTSEDFVNGFSQQYAHWMSRAFAKHDTAVSEEQKRQIKNDYIKLYELFLNQICAQNDLTDDKDIQEFISNHPKGVQVEGVEDALKLIYGKVVKKFAEKEKSNIDEQFLQPIWQDFNQIDLKHGRNMEAMETELKSLMPAGVEVFTVDAALCFRDPKTNLVYVVLLPNNTIQKKWRDFFIAPKGVNVPVEKVLKPAIAFEQKSKSGTSSWALIQEGEVKQY